MALVDDSGTILVDDAGLMWRRRDSGMSGLEGLDGLGAFNWEGFGSAAAGIGGAIAGIIVAKKTGQAPISGVGVQASGSGFGSSGSFSISPTMIMLGAAALILVVKVMKK